MILTQLAVWAWAPIALAAVATQASGGDIGTIGTFLVPGSAAASVIACVFLFLKRMEKAGDEQAKTQTDILEANSENVKRIMESHSATVKEIMESQDGRIRTITEAHSGSISLLSEHIQANTEAIREMNRWIRECNLKGKPNLG